MGYRTPNIDRIADEGVRFTDYYGEQSCTAGRAAFITGQNPYRTGLTKVGMPGADDRLQAEDPTIADALKPQGYATGQFGKNHLGDRDEFLPTVHGFDEFFGNLYHLNAEEEPELARLPDRGGLPELPRALRPARRASTPGRNADGTQRIEDTGPLTKKRMETIDDEFIDARRRLHRPPARGGHAVLRVVQLHPHALPHPRQAREPRPGRAVAVEYHDTMIDHDDARRRPARPARRARHRRRHDRHLLDRQRAAHELVARRRHDAVPQREEHQLGGRLPRAGVIRWPGQIAAGHGLNGIVSHNDWLPTLLAAAGEPDIAEQLKAGTKLDGTTYKVHLDGYNLLPYLTGEVDESPRAGLLLLLRRRRPDGAALRQLEARVPGAAGAGHAAGLGRAFTELRVPKLFNLRTDPYERADITSNTYYDWLLDHACLVRARADLRRPDAADVRRSSRRARSRRASASTR